MYRLSPTQNPTVPVIDLAPFLAGTPDGKRQVAAVAGQACQQIGFLTFTGHNVPANLVEQTSAVARQFFDLPDDQKRQLKLTPAGVGYSPLRGERLAASLSADAPRQAAPADLKESLNIGADFALNLWPAHPAELRPVMERYFTAMNRLAADLLRVFATALDLPEDYFAGKIDRASAFLRVINYPPPAEAPEPGQLRAGAHTDYGTLTILRSENVAGGLQVRSRAGDWLDVVVPPGAFVVNLGDMMMRWTNDRWTSTLHRVVNPPSAAGSASRRQSLAFFHNPNPDAVIECLPTCCGPDQPAKYPPILAGEFIQQKARQAYGG